MLALLIALPGAGQAADSLVVFKAGDTARAAAVNANFKVLWERMNALSAENRTLAAENRAMAAESQNLGRRVDSLRNARPSAPNVDSLEAKIAGMRMQIQVLQTRMDSSSTRVGDVAAGYEVIADSLAGLVAALRDKASTSHVHAISQVTGLQDSLKAKIAGDDGAPLRVCVGSTDAGQGWRQYDSNPYAVVIDVSTAKCGFKTTPQYFTSLGGTNRHYVTTGATSIYSPTATSFRIYVGHEPWAATHQLPPSTWNFHINWIAIGN